MKFVSLLVLLTTMASTAGISNNTVTLDKKISAIIGEIEELKDSNFTFYKKFNNSNGVYNVYSFSKNSENTGYLITNSKNEILSFYVGNSSLENKELSDLSPLFSENNIIDDFGNDEVSVISTFDPDMPTLNVDLYDSYSGTGCSIQEIQDCPFYYNYSYGPVQNGCAPTVGAMLVSFYDRYSSMSNLVTGLLPLNHEDDKDAVDALITELASSSYMNTNTLSGTTLSGEINGLTNYFMDKGYSSYKAKYTSDYDNYSYIINTKKQPAFLSIELVDNNDNVTGYHAVLGVGTSNIQYSGSYMITHYDWYNENTGNYYVKTDYFRRCIYIGK